MIFPLLGGLLAAGYIALLGYIFERMHTAKVIRWSRWRCEDLLVLKEHGISSTAETRDPLTELDALEKYTLKRIAQLHIQAERQQEVTSMILRDLASTQFKPGLDKQSDEPTTADELPKP